MTRPQSPPVAPVEPGPWECCGNGCDPCVYDRYWEELARYENALALWQQASGLQTDRTGTEPSESGGGDRG